MKWVGFLWLSLLLAGCTSLSLPYGREIEETVLMGSLAVDLEESGLQLTATSHQQASSDTEAVLLSAQAQSISGGLASLQSQGEEWVFFGHVEQILLGEDMAKKGLKDVLDFMATDGQLRLESSAWVVKEGRAGDLLSNQQEGGANQRLETLEQGQQLTQARNAREALVDLEYNGCTYLPAIVQGEGIVPVGYALFREEALCGWLTEELAQGFDLLIGQVEGQIVELSQVSDSVVAVELSGACTQYQPIFTGEILTGLQIKTKVEAEVVEYRGLGHSRGEDWVQPQLEVLCQTQITEVVGQLQQLDADVLHWQALSSLTSPWEKEKISQQWAEQFAQLDIQIEVEVELG